MKRYNSLNGLKAILCIGIILMHIKENTNFEINGFVYNSLIPYFTNFIFLFMMISAFSMCCGYYYKFKNKEIDLNEFYKKRYKRILPFFAIVVLIEVLYAHNSTSVIEGFANLTLLFGFLPNIFFDIAGVGWFLGVIFVFYIIFPFFVFLLDNKPRAWFSFVIALLLNFECMGYFYTNKYVVGDYVFIRSFLFNLVFFITGGIIFLYKDQIKQKIKNKEIFVLFFIILLYIPFFLLDVNEYFDVLKNIFIHAFILIFFICYEGKILNNPIVSFIGNISLEMYLSHMLVFRLLEKFNFISLTTNEICNYVISCVLVLCGAILFTCIINYSYKYLVRILSKKNKLLDEAK